MAGQRVPRLIDGQGPMLDWRQEAVPYMSEKGKEKEQEKDKETEKGE